MTLTFVNHSFVIFGLTWYLTIDSLSLAFFWVTVRIHDLKFTDVWYERNSLKCVRLNERQKKFFVKILSKNLCQSCCVRCIKSEEDESEIFFQNFNKNTWEKFLIFHLIFGLTAPCSNFFFKNGKKIHKVSLLAGGSITEKNKFSWNEKFSTFTETN